MNDHDGHREELQRQADDVRTKLVTTIERIDQRRHDLLDVPKQIGRHLKGVVAVVGLMIVASAGVAAFATYRLVAGRRRPRSTWRLARGAGSGPVRAAPPRRSFVKDVARSLALTLVTTLLARPLRRAVGGQR
jgi:hypothetical protein